MNGFFGCIYIYIYIISKNKIKMLVIMFMFNTHVIYYFDVDYYNISNNDT
jgi:hypothetical protein